MYFISMNNCINNNNYNNNVKISMDISIHLCHHIVCVYLSNGTNHSSIFLTHYLFVLVD